MADNPFQFPTIDPFHYGQRWFSTVARVKDLGAFVSQELGDTSEITQGLQSFAQNANFPIKAFAGAGDLGFGNRNSQGGTLNFGSFLRFNLMAGVVPTLQQTSPSTTGTISAISNFSYATSKLALSKTSLTAASELALTTGLGDNLQSTKRLIIATANTLRSSANIAAESGLYDTEYGLSTSSETLLSIADSLTESSASYKVSESLALAAELTSQANITLNNTSSKLTDIGHLISGITTLNSALGETLSQSWNILNSGIGNSLITSAYSIVGRILQGDGAAGTFSLGSAFVGQMLANAGVPPLETMSPKAYQTYGRPVDFHDPRSLRVNDIVILKSRSGIHHMGFLKSFNPLTKVISLMGAGGSGVSMAGGIKFSMTDPTLYITHVRRNWPPVKTSDLPTSSTSSGGE